MKKLAALLAILSLFSIQLSIVNAQETIVPPELTSASAEGFTTEGFTIEPAEPNTINPRKFIYEIKPGDKIEDAALVKNLSDKPATFYFYGADPSLSTEGTLAYETRDSGHNAEGTWVKFDTPEVVLKGKEQRVLKFTIEVPADTPLNEYRAGIAMEKTKKDINNANITIATRVVIHSAIHVKENPQPIEKTKLTAATTNNTTHDAASTTEDTKSPWQIYYFWISLVLFVISFISLIYISFEEKKKTSSKEEQIGDIVTFKEVRSTPKKTIAKKKPAKKKVTTKKPTSKRKVATKKPTTKKKTVAKRTTAKKITTKKAAPKRKTTAKKVTKKKAPTKKK